MYIKQLFTNGRVGAVFVITLGCLYVLSILACTIGFFTPYWLHDVRRYTGFVNAFDTIYGSMNYRFYESKCDTAGLVSGQCRFPYTDALILGLPDTVLDVADNYWTQPYGGTDSRGELGRNMDRTFYCVLGTMFILYTNLAMTLVGYIFNLFDNKIFVSFISIHYGVLYPLGAISVLFASISLEVKYESEVGFSTILGTISGGFMIILYFGLLFYNDQYMKHCLKSLENEDKKVGNNNNNDRSHSWKNGRTFNHKNNKKGKKLD